MRIAGMLAVSLLVGCNVSVSSKAPSCGAEVAFKGADGHWLSLDFANTTGDAIEIGGGTEASFVDTDGVAMEPQMTPGEESWFMPFTLPGHSHRTVKIRVKGGTPAQLARIEVPHSGETPLPECTINATF
jgi:hypothetical protein